MNFNPAMVDISAAGEYKMDTIISYSVKIGNVAIECFTDQTYGSEKAAMEKAKSFYDAYLIKVPTANLSIVKSVKRRNVKPL